MENEKIMTNPIEEIEVNDVDAVPAEEVVPEVAAPEEVKEEVREEPAKEAPARKAAAPIKLSRMVIDDGNDLVTADIPENRQFAELERMRRDIMQKNICYARVLGVEITDDQKVRMILKRDTIRIVISGDDFFHYSQLKDIEKASENEKFIRYRRKGTHMVDGVVSFIPLAMDFDEGGIPVVVASRKQAMERLQERHFFGRHPDAKVGVTAKASILSTGPRYVTVECLGVESVIGSGSLSAFSYIENVSDEYHAGDGLMVAIEHLEVDKENRTIDIRFSHALVERGTAKVETVSERLLNSRYGAVVTGQNENFYFVIVKGMKFRGIVPKNLYIGTEPLLNGNEVSFLVTGLNKEKNLLIGRCIKTKD